MCGDVKALMRCTVKQTSVRVDVPLRSADSGCESNVFGLTVTHGCLRDEKRPSEFTVTVKQLEPAREGP